MKNSINSSDCNNHGDRSLDINRYRCQYYADVIMSAMTSQLTAVSIVCTAVFPGADLRKHQSSTPLVFVRGIHLWSLDSPPYGPVTLKMFTLMTSSWTGTPVLTMKKPVDYRPVKLSREQIGGLARIWHRCICNYHDEVIQSLDLFSRTPRRVGTALHGGPLHLDNFLQLPRRMKFYNAGTYVNYMGWNVTIT